jgi:hypothetical protein
MIHTGINLLLYTLNRSEALDETCLLYLTLRPMFMSVKTAFEHINHVCHNNYNIKHNSVVNCNFVQLKAH